MWGLREMTEAETGVLVTSWDAPQGSSEHSEDEDDREKAWGRGQP